MGEWYMGRLSDYINSGGGGNRDAVEVDGFRETSEMLGDLLTTNPYMAGELRAYIRKVLREARGRLSSDAASAMKEDPRKAARAVKHSIYKQLFGGNISILQKRRGTAGASYELVRMKKLRPGQRGGNRRLRVDDARNRLEKYFGADRGFILRFINSGTVERKTRYGSRGNIGHRGWFEHTAPYQIEEAASKVAQWIEEYVTKQTA